MVFCKCLGNRQVSSVSQSVHCALRLESQQIVEAFMECYKNRLTKGKGQGLLDLYKWMTECTADILIAGLCSSYKH